LLRPAHSVRNYLFTIVLNLYRDRRRREMRVRQVSLDVLQGAGFEPGAEDDHAADCADQDLARFVRERVDNLPDEERAVVLMKKLGEMSYEGIAEASGDSVRTVKRRVRSALDRLARDLARCGFRIEEACLWMLIG
jgi:RNA polymerase sigma-70 factor (ECF subfamily)